LSALSPATDGTFRNGANVGVAQGHIGEPAKLGASITILLRSVKVQRVGTPFDKPTWVLVVDGRFENRTDDDAYVDASTICKGQDTGYYLAGSKWSGATGPAPAQSYLRWPGLPARSRPDGQPKHVHAVHRHTSASGTLR
jgi:hypothetical protein